MAARWDEWLERWVDAGLVDAASAARIRDWESAQPKPAGQRWPVLLALAFGALLVGAGVLLFVSAHWDKLSPAWRMALVLLLVASFHAGGAITAERFAALSAILHAVGSMALGAGIYLAGQIFHLAEHWPSGLMLWGLGALIGWAILRDWIQLALAAVLIPGWLASEWAAATDTPTRSGDWQVVSTGMLILAITYFTARTDARDTALRSALMWIGGIALLPNALAAASEGFFRRPPPVEPWLLMIGWGIAVGAPLVIAFLLRGTQAWINLISAVWAVVLTVLAREKVGVMVYGWGALGAIGMAVWGLRERSSERINMGAAGFAITILIFYFSSVMDKLGRAASLIGLGVLFLAGGWALEKLRRRLIARTREADR